MVDQIVELENGHLYLVLDKTAASNRVFYFGVRLDEKEQPTNNYLFFEELKNGDETFFDIVEDEEMKGALLVAFSANYVNMAYDL